MAGEDPAQFPEWPTFTEEKYHEISAGSLREMIRRTLFAVADETGRYSMTGVLWDLDGDTARLVGSDGYRLALAQGTATAARRPHHQGPDAGRADQGDEPAGAQPPGRPGRDGEGLHPAQRRAVPHRAGR